LFTSWSCRKSLRGQLEASRQAESELRRLIVHMDPGPARRKSLPERVGEWFRGVPEKT